jgi:prolyl-tRNA editing enzyme YbaK/EbsC (Cys-tRNA(Pro) deacylase)
MCGAELQSLPEGMQRIAAWLAERDHPHVPIWLQASAHTAQEAADALGIALGQVAKSIVFRRLPDDRPVLVIASGDRRVDEAKVAALVCGEGQTLGRANAGFVKRETGFGVGGVSPIGHRHPPLTLLDESLGRFDAVWAAAGHPNGLFQLTLADLVAWTGAPVVDITPA